ncbi:MAG: IgGFc-binding protein [Pseudomonadota bacterium]
MRADNAKPIKRALLLVSLLLTACGGGAKTTCTSAPAPAPAPVPVVTSSGTDFFLTLPNHLCASSPSSCNIQNTSVSNKLIVTAATATTGEATFYGVVTPFSVPAGGEVVITLNPVFDSIMNKWVDAVLTNNEVVEAKGIHVTALSPVSVHVVSETPYTADGYLALPTAGLGTSYYVMSYASTGQIGSEFAVVATQDNTSVTITPKAAGSTNPANVPFTVVLNIGQTYQFENPAYDDVTGTLVTADKPIAVFSGHRFANLPSSFGYGDYLVEQLPDVSIWGKTHHTSLFNGRSSYTVRVLASQNNTTFTSTIPAGNAAAIGTLNAGEFRDVVMSGVGEFISDKPVLVAQFMHGFAEDNTKGDPSMVIVTPAEQGMIDSTFGVHGLAGTTGAFMNVVTKTAELANLKLDNVAVDLALTPFTKVGGTIDYSTGMIPVTPGAHTLQGSGPYSALVYDYGIGGNAVSYAYPVGANLSAPVTQTATPANSSPAVCVNSQVAVSNLSDDDSEHEEHASIDHHENHEHDDAHDLDA